VTGRRFTWVIVAGVGALLLFAGVDALRSSRDNQVSATTAPTTAVTTTADDASGSLLPCDVEDLTISIEVRRGIPTVVARNTGDRCYRVLRGWHLRVEDRSGKAVAEWTAIQLLVDGIFPAGSESAFRFSQDPIPCGSPGPYLASAAVGPYIARRGHLSAGQVVCSRARTAEVRREIERVGNEWASLFASDLQTCEGMTQPLCERIACKRVGGIKIKNCTQPTRAFRRSFEDATVQDVVIKHGRAAARFSNGEVVMIVYASALDTWFVHKLGDNAGRGFFE
jgi:hypothetical protein